ncbi:NRDE protein-domain-containing protein [Scenedesmus sp. NREL 46B-D3]|nr:NRDE protein-domain-containing protein [Scenedesmus sp. NREL 46B-D3]
MCTSLFIYDIHPALLLLLTFNRDEFFDRPTQPAHFWPDEPFVLAGRDALRNGTWLGLTKHGRLSLLTNYREPISSADPGKFVKTTDAPSRGALTTDFLTGSMGPLEYLQGLPRQDYYGFNLLVADLQQRQLAYVSNRGPTQPQLLPPGCYGVSNGLLQQWPKVRKGLSALLQCLGVEPSCTSSSTQQPHMQPQSRPHADCTAGPGDRPARASSQPVSSTDSGHDCAAAGSAAGAAEPDAADAAASGLESEKVGGCSSSSGAELPWGALFHQVMGDTRQVAAGEALPLTGVGEDTDRRLSSIFVEPLDMQPGAQYGTRSQTIIAVWRDGRVEQRERYIEREDGQEEAGKHQWMECG